MTEGPATSLTAALAAVQAKLPAVGKEKTATVKTKDGGTYRYSYADLAKVSRAVLPLLGEHGLAWITRPTLRDDGQLVLTYELRHVSGEHVTGEYPLPAADSSPQVIGSAVTYARRYCLCSVTGVAPEQDDDDAAAATHHRRTESPPAGSGHGGDEWETAQPQPLMGRAESAMKRQHIIARALAAIADATTRGGLETLGLRVTEREVENAITADDAVNLRRHIVERLDELFPTTVDADLQNATIPIGEKQRRRMHALFRDVGLGGPGDDVRSLRLAKVALIIGRDVDTTNDLTAAEADQVNTALEAERKEKSDA